ncbi:hypothetical protein SAMN04487936_106230 [Halobacillus dabanensis]|uniref:Uncharacterized protein n=1 Tax=Halobacillus dabanensis TaxID=240302 RepID=A0A1I3W861_HALDA|nr:hypothetical protein [Halobacillus dabanensis]SFK03373.1 hypothetical protein SAMN04487936_106230 [Halobacillus dabanensis]
MSAARILMWVTGALEAFLGIPFFGGTFVISLLWTPLAVMLVLHIVTLVLAQQIGRETRGSVLGIITSCIAWIPIVGMVMHILTAIFLLIDASEADPELEKQPD